MVRLNKHWCSACHHNQYVLSELSDLTGMIASTANDSICDRRQCQQYEKTVCCKTNYNANACTLRFPPLLSELSRRHSHKCTRCDCSPPNPKCGCQHRPAQSGLSTTPQRSFTTAAAAAAMPGTAAPAAASSAERPQPSAASACLQNHIQLPEP